MFIDIRQQCSEMQVYCSIAVGCLCRHVNKGPLSVLEIIFWLAVRHWCGIDEVAILNVLYCHTQWLHGMRSLNKQILSARVPPKTWVCVFFCTKKSSLIVIIQTMCWPQCRWKHRRGILGSNFRYWQTSGKRGEISWVGETERLLRV